MEADSEFSRVWAMPTAILLERDMEDTEEVAVTTTGAAEDDGAAEDLVKNRPADRLLEVEHNWVMLRIKSIYVCSPQNPEKASYMKHPICGAE